MDWVKKWTTREYFGVFSANNPEVILKMDWALDITNTSFSNGIALNEQSDQTWV